MEFNGVEYEIIRGGDVDRDGRVVKGAGVDISMNTVASPFNSGPLIRKRMTTAMAVFEDQSLSAGARLNR